MEKLKQNQEKFLRSLNALERNINTFLHADVADNIRESLVASTVKHFEICYEIAWKFLKSYLEYAYSIQRNSPKQVFRECFALGIIDAKTTKDLLDISEARNATTHDYDEETAQETCKRITQYHSTLKTLKNIKC